MVGLSDDLDEILAANGPEANLDDAEGHKPPRSPDTWTLPLCCRAKRTASIQNVSASGAPHLLAQTFRLLSRVVEVLGRLFEAGVYA
jgi:hypothetical protein